MIERWYEVSCDECNCCLNHYIGNKPTQQELKKDGFTVYKNYVFCSEDCLNKFKNK